MNTPLILPMMMYGKYKQTVTVKDPKTGKKKRVNKTIEHIEQRGDPGFYPSVNHIYIQTRKGRRLSQAAEDLFNRWNGLAQIWAEKNNWQMTEGEKVVVEIDTYFPNDRRKRDTSNALKLMLDALEGVIYDNDFFALPRQNDFHYVKEGEKPYFKLNIFKKSEE